MSVTVRDAIYNAGLPIAASTHWVRSLEAADAQGVSDIPANSVVGRTALRVVRQAEMLVAEIAATCGADSPHVVAVRTAAREAILVAWLG